MVLKVGRWLGRGSKVNGRASGGRVTEPARRVMKSAGRASKPAGSVSEPAARGSEPAGRFRGERMERFPYLVVP